MKIRNGFVSNSSSASFVCGKNFSIKDIEDIKNTLQDLLKFYNTFFNDNLKFEDVFDNPKKIEPNDLEMLKDYDQVGDKYIKNINDRIIIYSKDDNSIPYSLFDLISQKFNAYHIHLG